MARYPLSGIFLLSALFVHACVGERNEKAAEISIHVQNKAAMQLTNQSNADAARPKILTELYFCKKPEAVADLEMGPWSNTLVMKSTDQDLTGSTWKIVTFKKEVWQAVGIDTSKIADFNDNDLQFAFVNPGPLFQSGGFVFYDRATKDVVGAQQVCDSSSSPSYLMKFKKPIIVDNIPQEFTMGRMNRVTLPVLKAAGAQRFTWVHKDVALRNFKAYSNTPIKYGGFLYAISSGGKNYLEFYEREGFPTSNAIGKA